MVTNGLDGSLFIFAEKQWRRLLKSSHQTDLVTQIPVVLIESCFAHAFETDVDAQRLHPHSSIHSKKQQGFTSKVVLAGMYSRIEMWDETRWKDSFKESSSEADALAGKLSDLACSK